MTAEKFLAEVFGTGMLILLGDGVVAAVLLSKSKAQNAGWIVITIGMGDRGVLRRHRRRTDQRRAPEPGRHHRPGRHGRPACSGVRHHLGRGPGYLLAELIGAMIGAALVVLHYWDHFKATEDQGLKLAVFSTGPNIRNYGLNLISEIIGTFVLVFVIFAFGQYTATPPGSHRSAPCPSRCWSWSIGLSLGGTTGYAINPARDLGPRIIHAILPIPGKGGSDWEYSWVPVVGPLIGGGLAAIVYYVAFTQLHPGK